MAERKILEFAATVMNAELPTDVKELPLEERAKTIMRKAQSHWALEQARPSEDEKFRVSVALLLMHSSEEEKVRIEHEVKMLKMLSAAMDGVPVDFSSTIEEEDSGDKPKPVQLMRLWHEVTGETEQREDDKLSLRMRAKFDAEGG